MSIRIAATLLAAIAATPMLSAQGTTGSVRGQVVGPTGEPATAVTVTAIDSSRGITRGGVTASDGVFQIRALPPGNYTIFVRSIGHRPVAIDSVRVALGATTAAPKVALEATPDVLAERRIVASRVGLDPERTSVGGSISRSDVEGLPGGRDHTALIPTLPHANTSYHGDPVNVGGATGLENAYFIDGVNVTAPFRATSGTRLPHQFVRDVEVRMGGFEPRYGKALGAIVNAVTLTGTNDLRWGAFAFHASDALTADARSLPALAQTGALAADAGAWASGPLSRDRVWYAVALNPRVEQSTRRISGIGAFEDRARSNVFAAKLTWQATPSSRLELSTFGDPTTRDAVLPPTGAELLSPLSPTPYLARMRNGGTSTSLRLQSVLRRGILLEAALSRSAGNEDYVANTSAGRTEEPFIDRTVGTISGGIPWQTTAAQRITTASLHATIPFRTHEFGVGVEFEDAAVERTLLGGAGVGRITRQNPTTWQSVEESADGTFHNRSPAFYAQDAWRLTPALTMTGGVRWSRQDLVGASGRVAQRLADEWQPRLGVSWQVGESRRDRIFASAGRFYQQLPLNLSSLYYVEYPWIECYYNSDPRIPGAVAYRCDDYSAGESAFPEVAGAEAQHTDEIVAGYERLVGDGIVVSVRAWGRELRTAFQQGMGSGCPLGFCVGNPGSEPLAFLPRARRSYRALELTAVGSWRALDVRASYVLSRNRGNHVGLYGADAYFGNPGVDYGLTIEAQGPNSTGLLPNDRTHVVKVASTWRPRAGLSLGAILTVGSGTPLSLLSGSRTFPTFHYERGAAGRLPSLANLELRLASVLPRVEGARILLDASNLLNSQRVVRAEQFLFQDGSTASNPDYGRATLFAPPRIIRLGIEIAR